MKMMICALMLSMVLMASASISIAEDWYVAQERCSNDYRDCADTMARNAGEEPKYAPGYTNTELANTRAMADARQLSQPTMIASQDTPLMEDRTPHTGPGDNGH